ncbi:MAG: efflux RND transporter periplasmic adaptor subunit, partial [Gemmatimonadota bacterium]|nr:efflux RND transporter periplasmic adaptor subunit [Gemmatimonadota bacterium]
MKPKTIKSPPAGLACFLWAVLILSLSCQSTSPRYPERNIARVFRRDFSSTVLAAGVVTAQVGAEVRVGARVAGKVERLYTNIGDRVEKGDVIAQLEKDDIEATVNQRKAELELARSRLLSLERLFPKEIEKEEADIARWQATVTLARKELARKEDLLKDDLASEQDLDQAQEQLAVARAEHVSANKTLELTRTKYTEDIKLAGIEVQSTKATLANAEAQLSFTTITAPISGVIASVSTQEGETVTAGLNAPTFVTIIDLNRLQTDSYVDEVDIGKIEPGQRAVFTVDAFQQREFEGIVKAVHPKAVIQDNVVNYVVEIDIAQPYEGL